MTSLFWRASVSVYVDARLGDTEFLNGRLRIAAKLLT